MCRRRWRGNQEYVCLHLLLGGKFCSLRSRQEKESAGLRCQATRRKPRIPSMPSFSLLYNSTSLRSFGSPLETPQLVLISSVGFVFQYQHGGWRFQKVWFPPRSSPYCCFGKTKPTIYSSGEMLLRLSVGFVFLLHRQKCGI